MAASDRNTRRANEAERARHIAGSEAAAFATTAGTMLLGLLAGAEAAQNRNEPQPPAAATPPPPTPHPNEVAPSGSTPTDHPPTHVDRHAAVTEGSAADPIPMTHADAAAIVEAPHPAGLADAPPDGQAVTAHPSTSSIPVWTVSATTHQPSSPPEESTSINGATAPSSIDPGGPVHQLSDTIAGVVDASLAPVTQTIASLGTAVGQLTSSLSDSVSDLVGGLTGLVTNLTHHTPATDVAEPQVADIPGPTPAAADSPETIQHDASLFDTAGAVPMALLHPLPLHLGFLGQPTTDGHDTHDGAFSALGVHHF